MDYTLYRKWWTNFRGFDQFIYSLIHNFFFGGSLTLILLLKIYRVRYCHIQVFTPKSKLILILFILINFDPSSCCNQSAFPDYVSDVKYISVNRWLFEEVVLSGKSIILLTFPPLLLKPNTDQSVRFLEILLILQGDF